MQVSIAKVIRITHTLSILLSVLTAFIVPVIYFSAGYQKEVSILSTEAEVNAGLATTIINRNPVLWRYESERLEEFLSRRPFNPSKENRRIVDGKGVLIAEYGDVLEPPVIKRDYPLYDSGRIVGRLEITRSLRGLIKTTAEWSLVAALCAFLVYLFMLLFPLRALDQALGTLTDLNRTLEKRVAEEVARGREKDLLLMQQSKLAAMGEMIGSIAHQWRQPLNTVGLIVQDIRNASQSGTLGKGYLDDSVEKTMAIIRHMSMTIDDFRNFYLPEKERRRFNVGEVVVHALSVIRASFEDKGIAIDIDAEKDLTVDGFPNEFVQVLLNLLGNARDVLIERKIENPRVTVRCFREDDGTVVTIGDNAGGISGDIAGKIFDPYFSTKKETKGTGIGLYMSKVIVEKNMNGKLTAYNTGDGAEFRVELWKKRGDPGQAGSPEGR